MFSFNPALERTLDRVRLLTSDTDAEDHTLEDETILATIENEQNVWLAAAECRDLMASIWRSRLSTGTGASDVSAAAVTVPSGWDERTRDIRHKGMQAANVSLFAVL